MRILGADGFVGNDKAMDNIPSAPLFNGDMCMAKYPSTEIDGEKKVYFYILDADHGGIEDLPNVVVPRDNATLTTAKRWILINVYTTFDLLYSGDAFIPIGVSEVSVVFPIPRFNASYSLLTEIYNLADAEPSIIHHIVVEKSTTGFTARLSAGPDTGNYRLQWAILGENVDYESYYLQDVDGFNITDKHGAKFTVY